MGFFNMFIAPLSVLLPIIAGLVYYKYLHAAHKVVLFYVIYSAIANAFNILLMEMHYKTIISFHVSSIVWFAFISFFYMLLFGKLSRKVIIPLIVIFTAFSIVNLIFIQKHNIFNTYTSTLNAIIIIVYAMVYIYKQNMHEADVNWNSNGLSWINTGFLLYYSVSLVMYIFLNYLTTLKIGIWVWGAHNAALSLMYVLFVIGFRKCKT